jgi:hypothetical protein
MGRGEGKEMRHASAHCMASDPAFFLVYFPRSHGLMARR